MTTSDNALFEYLLRLGDDTLILGQRLGEWCGHGPILEEDIALTNVALDQIGQATSWLQLAGKVEAKGRSNDDLAFLRLDREYRNSLLVEQPNGDFGHTIVRQMFFDVYTNLLYAALEHCGNEEVAAIAAKSLKEVKYHLGHSSRWVIRLGDGTQESHDRAQQAVDDLWMFTGDLFISDEVNEAIKAQGIDVDMDTLQAKWLERVKDILAEATLTIPENTWMNEGGRKGVHTEHLGFLLAEMQYMQRAYPGMTW